MESGEVTNIILSIFFGCQSPCFFRFQIIFISVQLNGSKIIWCSRVGGAPISVTFSIVFGLRLKKDHIRIHFFASALRVTSHWRLLVRMNACHFPTRELLDFFFESRSSVENLALLVAHIRENSTLVHALARFALQIQINHRNCFRHLSTEANKRALAAKLDVVQICVDPIWIWTALPKFVLAPRK